LLAKTGSIIKQLIFSDSFSMIFSNSSKSLYSTMRVSCEISGSDPSDDGIDAAPDPAFTKT
jgi:hypothetical protein